MRKHMYVKKYKCYECGSENIKKGICNVCQSKDVYSVYENCGGDVEFYKGQYVCKKCKRIIIDYYKDTKEYFDNIDLDIVNINKKIKNKLNKIKDDDYKISVLKSDYNDIVNKYRKLGKEIKVILKYIEAIENNKQLKLNL